MNIFQAIVLGIVQGATEFLPVSSSGHLVLAPWLFGWEAPSLTFIIVAHWGTMIAVLIYFRSDWLRIIRGGVAWLRDRGKPNADARLLGLLVMGTIPAVLVGFVLNDVIDVLASQPLPASIFLLVTALILLVNSFNPLQGNSLQMLTWKDSIWVGLLQTFAIFPGISRSGITIAAGRIRGLSSESAARLSFLLALPIIFGAGVFNYVNLLQEENWGEQLPMLIAGFTSSAVAGYLSVHWLLGYLKQHSTLSFAVYCTLVGSAGLLISILGGG